MSKWTKLLDVYADFEEDPKFAHLRNFGTRLVPGWNHETADTAKVLIVGEAPGARENGAGRPFIGKSGVVLKQLCALAGLDLDRCFITNVVKYRPLGNRTPDTWEQLYSTPYLRREWAILRPRLTIAVGRVAHDVLRGNGIHYPKGELYPFGKARSDYNDDPDRDWNSYQHWITSMWHPAFGFRKQEMQPVMEADWTKLGQMIQETIPDVLEE